MRGIHRPEWTRQLPLRAGVNRGNDLGSKLIASALNSEIDVVGPTYEYALRRFGSRTGGTTVFGSNGLAVAYAGSPDYSTIPIDLTPYQTITVSFWLYWNSYTNNDATAGVYGNATASTTGFFFTPNSGGGNWIAAVFRSNTFSRFTFTRPSAAVWHHYAFHFDLTVATAFVAAFVDGFNVNLSANTNNMSAGGSFTSGLSMGLFNNDIGTAGFGIGRMLNFNIHRGLLTQVEIVRLMTNPYQQFAAPRSVALLPDGSAVLDANRYYMAC